MQTVCKTSLKSHKKDNFHSDNTLSAKMDEKGKNKISKEERHMTILKIGLQLLVASSMLGSIYWIMYFSINYKRYVNYYKKHTTNIPPKRTPIQCKSITLYYICTDQVRRNDMPLMVSLSRCYPSRVISYDFLC